MADKHTSWMLNMRGNFSRQLSTLISKAEKSNLLMNSLSTAIGFNLAQAADRAASALVEVGKATVQAGLDAEGVVKTFNTIFRPDQMDAFRRNVVGTVDDLTLMKEAIRADAFKIPLDIFNRGLKLARLRAQQTGEDVKRMVTSVTTGLGRREVRILDNLNFSSKQIRAAVDAVGGDFFQAADRLFKMALGEAGDLSLTASERFAQFGATIQNVQTNIGLRLLPVINALLGAMSSFFNFIDQNLGVIMDFGRVIGVLAGAWGLYTIATTLAGIATAVALSPITLAVVAIGAFLVAMTALLNKNKEFRSFVFGLWGAIKTVFQSIAELAENVFGGVKMIIQSAFNPGQGFFKEGKRMLADAFGDFGADVYDGYEEGSKKGADSFGKEGGLLSMLTKLSVGGSGRPFFDPAGGAGNKKGGGGTGLAGVAARAPKVINLNIGSLVESQEIHTVTMKEGVQTIKTLVARALAEAVNDALITASNT